MKVTVLLLFLLVCLEAGASGWGALSDSLTYYGRLGYHIGGTALIGMPASIRSLSKYDIPANITLALDVYRPLQGRWGLMAGLHFGNKGMETDARVKNYHMEMEQGGESIEGFFTGQVITKVEEWVLTLPIRVAYDLSSRFRLHGGPYVSYVFSHHFSGEAYNGYLRQGDPTGVRIDMGYEPETRGTYDFSSHMRRMQFGVEAGFDWNCYRRWGLAAGVSWGLTGVFKSDFHTIEQTLYPIYGTIGLTYRFK